MKFYFKLFSVLFFFFSIVSFSVKSTSLQTKILIFGDFGTGDDKQKLVADDMVQYCKQNGCHFAITTGDNIYPKGVGNDDGGHTVYDRGAPKYDLIVNSFVKNYKPLNIPIYLTFGNHDVGNEGVISVFKDLLKNQAEINQRTTTLMRNQIDFSFDNSNPNVTDTLTNKNTKLWIMPHSHYSVDYPGVSLFSIDSNTFPHGVFDEKNELNLKNPKNFEQANWLSQDLPTKTGWKIVFGHMPLVSHGSHGWADSSAIATFRNDILPILCKEKVDFYLSGHDHHLEVDQLRCDDGHVVTQVLSGAAGKSDRIYQRTFPIIAEDKNLLWGNGKHYTGSKLIFKNDDHVLGFAHLSLDMDTARLTMKLSKGTSSTRQDGCFHIMKGKAIKAIQCQ